MSVTIHQSIIDRRLLRPFGEGARNLQQFLDFPSDLYRHDSHYVRPLNFDLKGRLTTKNPFFLHAEGVLLTAHRHGKVVGRCTAQIDREHLQRYRDDVGFFGFFDTIDDADVAAALLNQATDWMRERGMRSARGPISLSMNEEVGCLVEGFDTPPMILMPHHHSFQGGLIEQAGFQKVKDLFAWSYTVGQVPARARRAADEIAALPELSFRALEPRKMERDVRLVMDIFNDAWSDNWGFVPMTESELQKLADDLRLLLVPELTMVVSLEGEPVAVAVALPDINEVIADFDGKLSLVHFAQLLWRLKAKGPGRARLALLGIRKKLRHIRKYAGLSTFMYVKMNEAGQKLGIRSGELSWTLEDNGPVNTAIRFMGGKVYKKYRIYEKNIG